MIGVERGMNAGVTNDEGLLSNPPVGAAQDPSPSLNEPPVSSPGSVPIDPGTPAEDVADDSIVALFTRLVDDAERFVRAELRLYRASLFSRLADARVAIVMLLTSFLIAQSAIIALLVGLVIILRPSLGAAGATAAVVGGGVATAALLAWLAIDKIRNLTNIRDKMS